MRSPFSSPCVSGILSLALYSASVCAGSSRGYGAPVLATPVLATPVLATPHSELGSRWKPSPDVPPPPRGPFAPGEGTPAPQESEHGDVDAIDEQPQQPISSDAKRAVPHYDAVQEPATMADVAIWIPRILLSPLYLVSEFVVRRPLGALATTAEKHHWPAILVDFFTFGPERNAGVIPTGIIDFGLRPSIGLYVFWNEFLADNNRLRARAATGGRDWWMLQLRDRLEVHPGHDLSVGGELSIRPDQVFAGLGPSSQDTEYRFGERRFDASFGYSAELWQSSRLTSFVGVRHTDFDADHRCCGAPSVAHAIQTGVFPEPDGLAQGYALLHHGMVATLDTRRPRAPDQPLIGVDFVAPPGSGLKLELRGDHAGGLADHPERYHFVRYGGTFGAFLDLTRDQRVLGLQVGADFADPIQEGGSIPFTELVNLGGDRPLRGFLPGRLRERSAAAARLTYTWPVWVWLDGALHYEVGNVFGEHLDGFELALLRSSFGLGLQTTGSRDHSFEVLIATGTETFRDGGSIENIRFVFGASSGF